MGMLNNLRNFFKRLNDKPVMIQEDDYEKSMLANQIVDLINKIKRINTFDSSIWNLSNISSYDLEMKSLSELEKLHSSLKERFSYLIRESQRRNPERESLEVAKWTGQKPKNLTNYEFDRLQRDEGR